MIELSVVAQAVLDAYQWAPIEDELTAAAVLRAVANEIEDLYCDSDIEDSPGIVFALRQLMLIADELERNKARRPKLIVWASRRSLKEQALKQLTESEKMLIVDPDGIIRRALEQLND